MARQLQLRRGTTAQHATFTGAVGEVTIDTDKDALVVHDGVLAGGVTAAKESTVTAHTSNTSNPHSVTKTQVGLGNAENTSDADKPVSTAQQTALNLKADLVSPALTGTPTAPTASVGDNSTQVATTAFVNAEIANDTYSKGQVDTSLTLKVNTTSAQALHATDALSISGSIITLSKGDGTSESVTLPAATADYEDIDDNLGLLIVGVLI